MSGWCLLTLTDNLLHLLAHGIKVDAQRLKSLSCNALALVNQTKQDVLGADVVVVQKFCFFLRQNDNSASLIGEFLEHLYSLIGSLFCWPYKDGKSPTRRYGGCSLLGKLALGL